MENEKLKQIFQKVKDNPTLAALGVLAILALLYVISRHLKTPATPPEAAK